MEKIKLLLIIIIKLKIIKFFEQNKNKDTMCENWGIPRVVHTEKL